MILMKKKGVQLPTSRVNGVSWCVALPKKHKVYFKKIIQGYEVKVASGFTRMKQKLFKQCKKVNTGSHCKIQCFLPSLFWAFWIWMWSHKMLSLKVNNSNSDVWYSLFLCVQQDRALIWWGLIPAGSIFQWSNSIFQW